ncbi:hypothetical protein ACWF0M_01865 [Kribbella sp. NPDC055110]
MTRQSGVRALAGLLTCLVVPAVVAAVPAQATVTRPCEPEAFYKVERWGGTSFVALAPPAGKYNAAPSTANLQYSISLTRGASSTAEVGAKASVKWGIATIEANTSYAVTNSVSSTLTVTDTLPVPGHYRGFDQPGVLRQRFRITKWQTLTNCSERQTYDYGTYNVIVGWPYYASCVTTASSCTPRP